MLGGGDQHHDPRPGADRSGDLRRVVLRDVPDFFQLLLSEEAMENALEARARALGIPLGEPRALEIGAIVRSTGRVHRYADLR